MMREAPQHQVMLALAMLRLDAKAANRHLWREAQKRRQPAKWRAIHANLDRAAAAIGDLN